jgi:drug/metabolite transporter (DMT)-like permease
MNDGLSFMKIVVLVAYAVGMAGGQILFKLAALKSANGSTGERLLGLIHNAYFLVAVSLYVGLTVLWVWILTFTPLSRAYAFVALAFVLTPMAGAVIFSEPISVRFVIGSAFVVVGLICVAG